MKLSELKAGDRIMLDHRFTCRAPGETVVMAGEAWRLCFECAAGLHYLDGQLGPDGETLIGISATR